MFGESRQINMAFRRTPFGDRLDRYLTYASLVWGLFFTALLVGTVTGEEGTGRAWLNFTTATTVVVGVVGVYGWWRQRRLLARLDDVVPGPRGDRAVVEGRITAETDTVAAPVVDDDRIGARGAVGDAGVSLDSVPGIGTDVGATSPDPDEGAGTRWYEARVVEYVRKTLGRGHKTETVHEERRGATPFLVETRAETVDLSGADLSFLQGERERFESRTVSVEDGELQLAGWSETLASDARLDVEVDGSTLAGAEGATAAVLGRAVGEGSGRLLRSEKYRVTGRRWAAATGERVHVVGEFSRRSDGRLVPVGEVTVGRGRFEDRLDEERERLERWTSRGRVGAVLLATGCAVITALIFGV